MNFTGGSVHGTHIVASRLSPFPGFFNGPRRVRPRRPAPGDTGSSCSRPDRGGRAGDSESVEPHAPARSGRPTTSTELNKGLERPRGGLKDLLQPGATP